MIIYKFYFVEKYNIMFPSNCETIKKKIVLFYVMCLFPIIIDDTRLITFIQK